MNMGRIIYDPISTHFYLSVFSDNVDWTEFYRGVEEYLLPSIPEPPVRAVSIYSFVDANHAGNVVTRRSYTGIIMFIQNATIICFSKRQNTVKMDTFGIKFVVLKICKDLIVALRYKLRMFGVILKGPAYVFYDNHGVVNNVSILELVLKKKHD